MEISDTVLDSLCARIMALPEISKADNSFVQMEDNGNGILWFKFMSDGGVTDDTNGEILHTLLYKASVIHDFFSGRKFFIYVDNLEKFLASKEVTNGSTGGNTSATV